MSDKGYVVGENEADNISDDDAIAIYDITKGENGTIIQLSGQLPDLFIGKIKFPRYNDLGFINDKGDLIVGASVLDDSNPKNPVWVFKVLLWKNVFTKSKDSNDISAISLVQYPTRCNLTLFNNNDVLVGINSNAPRNNVAVLLMPLTVTMTNRGNMDIYAGKFIDRTALGEVSELISDSIRITATIKQIAGMDLKIDILQDYQGGTVITCDNGSASAQLSHYYADDRLGGGDTNAIPVDTQGNLVFTRDDAPGYLVPVAGRSFLAGIEIHAQVRDFIRLQIGSKTPQVVAECKWSIDNLAANFKVSKMNPDPRLQRPSKYLNTVCNVTPKRGVVVYGQPATDTLTQPRDPTANTYMNLRNNWTVTPANSTNHAYLEIPAR